MTLLTWLLRKMGYVLVPWRQYRELMDAHKTCKSYFTMQDRNKMAHEREMENIKASYKDSNARDANIINDYERRIRDYDDALRQRRERIEALLAEVDRLQALLDESTKKYL